MSVSIQSWAHKSIDLCVALMYHHKFKISWAIFLKENTSVSPIALFYGALDMPKAFPHFLFLRTVFTLEGTLCHSENKPFDLLYKHNSISHTSVYMRLCSCVSVFVSLLQSSFISSKEKRDTSVDNIKQTKREKMKITGCFVLHTLLQLSALWPQLSFFMFSLSLSPSLSLSLSFSVCLSLWLSLPSLSPVVMDNWVTWSSLCWPAGPLPSADWASLPPTPPHPPMERQSSL